MADCAHTARQNKNNLARTGQGINSPQIMVGDIQQAGAITELPTLQTNTLKERFSFVGDFYFNCVKIKV
jgi:hypothetical protein